MTEQRSWEMQALTGFPTNCLIKPDIGNIRFEAGLRRLRLRYTRDKVSLSSKVGTPNTSSSGTCIPSFAKELP
jgi:hypothetical protein